MIEREAEMAQGRFFVPDEVLKEAYEGRDPGSITAQELETLARAEQAKSVQALSADLITGTSSKDAISSLLGARAGKMMVSAHPIPSLGVRPNRYAVGQQLLRQMLVAPGASREEREELLQEIVSGNVPGPLLNVTGYPGLESGQAGIVLGMTSMQDIGTRGLATPEELDDYFRLLDVMP